jgi:hypothetical protein
VQIRRPCRFFTERFISTGFGEEALSWIPLDLGFRHEHRRHIANPVQGRCSEPEAQVMFRDPLPKPVEERPSTIDHHDERLTFDEIHTECSPRIPTDRCEHHVRHRIAPPIPTHTHPKIVWCEGDVPDTPVLGSFVREAMTQVISPRPGDQRCAVGNPNAPIEHSARERCAHPMNCSLTASASSYQSAVPICVSRTQ